jgi:methyl-accepting chemotaxis protein
MNLQQTEKAAANRFFTPALIIALGICAAALVSLAIQIRLTGAAISGNAAVSGAVVSGDAAGKVKNILLWGEVCAVILFSLGLGALLFNIRILADRLSALQTLVKPLAEKKMTALLNLRKPASHSAKSGGLSGLPETAALEETLWSLGKLFEFLETFVRRSAGIRELLRGEGHERDTLHQHIGELINKITGQFFEIEKSAKQALESLKGIEDYIVFLKDMEGRQSEALEGTGDQLTRITDLSLSAASRIKESAGKAESLREKAGAGEEQAQEVNDLVKIISREVEGISEITAIINQISEQTNILSMNAAIESAHAGQAGAGFAVVAEEIRKLAESTKENAGRIHEELLSISKNTRSALTASQASFETFNGITGQIEDLCQELREISSAALETGAINGEIDTRIKESVLANRQLRDSSADVMAHHQSFKASLEQIEALSETTRAEIKEIHSGTGELLENMKKSQTRIVEDLAQAEKMSLLPGISGEAPAGDTAAGGVFPRGGGIEATAAEEKDWSGGREIAVKRPPRTIG